MSHRHFTRIERVSLQTLKRAGLSNRAIAKQLGFHPSTIGRELQRGYCATTPSGYSVKLATERMRAARIAANQQHRKLYVHSPLSLYVTMLLAKYWSPEQIALHLAQHCRRVAVSLHTIYRWIWNHSKASLAVLRQFLRHPKLRRKYGAKRREKQRELQKKHWIEERPAGATNRSRYGHWEGDTVLGAKQSGALVTLVERKSGYLLAAYIPVMTMACFRQATERLFAGVPPALKRSLTLDNGREMNDYEALERHTGLAVYFAHPYHSWERGTNENTNGLLRQFFPKGMDFSLLTQEQVDVAVNLLNTRPRKRLNAETPAEQLRKLGVAI